MLVDAPFSQSMPLLCSGEFVASLLEAGANGAVKNDSNHTPYELVRWAESTASCLPCLSVHVVMQLALSTSLSGGS